MVQDRQQWLHEVSVFWLNAIWLLYTLLIKFPSTFSMAEKVLISNGKHTIHYVLLVIIAVKLVPIYFYIYVPLFLSLYLI